MQSMSVTGSSPEAAHGPARGEFERPIFVTFTREQVPEDVDFFSVDVAFISLRLVLPRCLELFENRR